MQVKAIASFNWDTSVTVDSSVSPVVPGIELMTKGIRRVAPRAECKDLSCLKVSHGTYLQFPTYNFGREFGLTFSIWFRPASNSSNHSRLFDFSDSAGQNGILLGQFADTDTMLFSVKNAGTVWEWKSPRGMWKAGVWRHVVWSFAAAFSVAERPMWAVYFDGYLWSNFVSAYPADVELDLNYLGRASMGTQGQFVGYLDSLYIFPETMTGRDAKSLFQVSRGCEHVYVCTYVAFLLKRLSSMRRLFTLEPAATHKTCLSWLFMAPDGSARSNRLKNKAAHTLVHFEQFSGIFSYLVSQRRSQPMGSVFPFFEIERWHKFESNSHGDACRLRANATTTPCAPGPSDCSAMTPIRL
jgi:hypothetical protein